MNLAYEDSVQKIEETDNDHILELAIDYTIATHLVYQTIRKEKQT